MNMLRIMIIEDERNHFELMEHAIKKEFPDAMVELCEKADLCLDRLKESDMDIIIADYLLTGITGLELFEELKRREIDVPVIVVTGHGNENIAVKAMKLGAFDYVVKSGDFFELIPELIRKALRDRDLKAKMRRTEEEKKRLQAHLQQAQKMEAIATLAGGIAHQFNNALSSITGHTGLLEMEYPEDEKIMDYAKAMKQSAHRMAHLTSQLLAYARGGKYNPQTMSLSNFVEGTLPIIQHTLDPDIRLETDLPQDVMNVEVDRTQMQMVLSAIVAKSNEAIDPPGRIRISTRNMDIDQEFIKDHPGLTPGSYVCLSIEDDGKGMDEETRDRIFDPFFTTHFMGRGLGMASVYGIIKNHDGTTTVDSEIGKGTVVRIYLPAIPSAQARRAGLPAIEAEEEVEEGVVLRPQVELAMGEGTVLVIEDEEPLVKLFRQILEMLGYRVLEAMTGEEAVELAKTFDGQIDLALLDIKLPDMDGGRVYPLIMEVRPNLKVIVCSGYSINGPAQEILDAGAQAFIQKPFSISALAEKLKEVLEGK
ncbi:MAG: response regulator [Desulfobacteraceae bacterium]|nr:response regulator [Desulfobacteraceae bacterium]